MPRQKKERQARRVEPPRPRQDPQAPALEAEDLIVQARKRQPAWGPVALRAWLADRFPRLPVPSPARVAEILEQRGLTAPRYGAERPPARATVKPPFAGCTAPNATWCLEVAGPLRTGDGVAYRVFVLADAYSRLVLRCEAVPEANEDVTRNIVESAFREYGLPATMRCAGAPLFAPRAPAGLTANAAWLLRLGLVLERGAPAEPFPAREVEPAPDLAAQQRALDHLRADWNHARPHPALGRQTPGRVYRRSPAAYPRPLLDGRSGIPENTERVDAEGRIAWRRRRVLVDEALAGEWLTMWPAARRGWEVYFGAICIGTIDGATTPPRFRPARAQATRLSFTDGPT